MNTKHTSLAIAAAAALLAGCAKNPIEEVNPSEQLSDLELAYVGASETKAAIDGTDFPVTGEIGLFLFEDEPATKPYGDGYENVKYAYNTSKSRWTASPSIKVGSTPGYLYGYYPYNSESTDIKTISVESSLNGDDVMYATKQAVTAATASQTSITMNHALARVSITIKNNGYTGAAKLSKIKFGGAKTAESGTLNALDGTISATQSDVTLDVPTADQTITATGTTYECLLVPSTEYSDKQTVELTLTIDGQDKTATLSGDNGVIIAQNTKSNITITLSNSGISVQTISVDEWKEVEVGGHKVTVKTADGVPAGDIMYSPYVDGNDVIIKASSEIGQHLNCTLPGGEFCPQGNTDKLVYTFTLSDIESNITATIGYAKPVIVNTSSNNPDWGKVDANLTGNCYEGERIIFTANAEGGCQFVEWQDAKGEKLDWTNPQNIALTSDLTVKAVFIAPSGSFSVSTDGGKTTKQIFFSPGNLWDDLLFESKQYEYHTFNTWGLFGWSTDTSHYGKQTSTFYNDYSGPFIDWGWGISWPNLSWRTLSIKEWQYLFESRRNAANKVGFATVNNIHGIIILPDIFTDPKTNRGSESFVPKTNAEWDANVYTIGGNWEAMEEAGAVFLPAAGQREGENVKYEGIYGYYWSSIARDDLDAYAIQFGSDIANVNTEVSVPRYRGCSVRLVKDVTE